MLDMTNQDRRVELAMTISSLRQGKAHTTPFSQPLLRTYGTLLSYVQLTFHPLLPVLVAYASTLAISDRYCVTLKAVPIE